MPSFSEPCGQARMITCLLERLLLNQLSRSYIHIIVCLYRALSSKQTFFCSLYIIYLPRHIRYFHFH